MRGARRGLVLVLAIFFIGLLQLLVLAFARRLPTELYGSVRYELDNAAFLAADAGIQHTLGWLEATLGQGLEPVPAPPSVTRTGNLNGFRWEVQVTPDSQTPPNAPSGGQRAYTLEARALRSNVVYRRISVGVIQESFANYSRLVDVWPPGIVSLAGEEGYDGPVHTNSKLRVGLTSTYETVGPTLFKSGVSFSQAEPGSPDKVDYDSFYTGPRPYASSSVAVRRARYKKLYGQQRVKGVRWEKAIPMPSPDENLRRSAWGPPPVPTAPGVYLNGSGTQLSAGVYISGDVDSLELKVVGGDYLQQIRLANGDQYVITEHANGTHLQGPAGLSKSYVNHPNGVLFCSGDIRGLKGENQGPHTVAVNTEDNHKIYLAGTLRPASFTGSLGNRPDDAADALGLIAHSLVLPASLPRTPKYVYGALLLCGGDGQGGVEAEAPGSGGFSDLTFVGSVTTQQVKITMMPSGPTGWAEHFKYDENLKWSPPPAFPGIPSMRVRAYSCE